MLAYYLGAEAIAHRLGYRSKRMVLKLMIREGLPVYRRSVRRGQRAVTCLAISESALTAWELAKGQQEVARVRARRAEHQRANTNGLARQQRKALHELAQKNQIV